jgi:hypothetical protein
MRSLSAIVLFLVTSPALALAQDECTGAIPVVDGPNGPFSNVGATTSPPAWPCGAAANDLWFVYTATCTGLGTFDTCGSSFDTVIQVFDTSCGNTCAASFPLGGPCNDDACSQQSRVTLAVRAAGVYYIRVAGFEGAGGNFFVNVGCSAGGGPADDECTGPTAVVLGGNGVVSNSGYTTSIPNWPCTSGGNDRWFRFVPATNGAHTFDTCSAQTNFDTVLQVFAGPCGCTMASLGCNDDTCGLGSSVTASLCQGQPYLIRVGGLGGAVGAFELTVTANPRGTFAYFPHQCNGASHTGITIAASGDPNVGGSVTITASSFAPGAPAIGFGFQTPPFPVPYFCCTIGHDWAVVTFAASSTLPIPCVSALAGANVYSQALSFPQASGCAPSFNLSDTVQVTIG